MRLAEAGRPSGQALANEASNSHAYNQPSLVTVEEALTTEKLEHLYRLARTVTALSPSFAAAELQSEIL